MIRRWNELEHGKQVSLVLAVAYLALTFLVARLDFPGYFTKLLMLLVLALTCVWFGDEIGELQGVTEEPVRRAKQPSPGVIIRMLGWGLLFLPIPWFVRIFGG